LAQLLERLEARQHRPESQGGDDGDSEDRADSGKRT
jgi:hypothetical protein